jgi:hypothetical protein
MKGAYRDDQARLTVRVPEAHRQLEDLRAQLTLARQRYDAAKAALEGKVGGLPARWNRGMFVVGLTAGAFLGLVSGLSWFFGH